METQVRFASTLSASQTDVGWPGADALRRGNAILCARLVLFLRQAAGSTKAVGYRVATFLERRTRQQRSHDAQRRVYAAFIIPVQTAVNADARQTDLWAFQIRERNFASSWRCLCDCFRGTGPLRRFKFVGLVVLERDPVLVPSDCAFVQGGALIPVAGSTAWGFFAIGCAGLPEVPVTRAMARHSTLPHLHSGPLPAVLVVSRGWFADLVALSRARGVWGRQGRFRVAAAAMLGS